MDRRLKFDAELRDLIGSNNVYYQPPASVRMSYPAIKYSASPGADKRNANNRLYMSTDRYEVTVIDRDPDSAIPDKILHHFPMCNFDRGYSADNLNHFVYTIYY